MVSTVETARLNLSALAEGIMPGLNRAAGELLLQAAVVCLENREHRSGVTFGGYMEDRTTIAFAEMIEREFGGFSPPRCCSRLGPATGRADR